MRPQDVETNWAATYATAAEASLTPKYPKITEALITNRLGDSKTTGKSVEKSKAITAAQQFLLGDEGYPELVEYIFNFPM